MLSSLVQVTVWPLAEQVQSAPLLPAAKVRPMGSVSTTVSGLLPLTGSPVGPLPLFRMLAVICAFCSFGTKELPAPEEPLCPSVGATVTVFSVKFTHQPFAAPAVPAASSSVM